MEPTRELVEAIYRDKVQRARRSTLDQKFRDGLELFDFACRLMIDGIRMQHPGISEDEIQQKLKDRLALLDRTERGVNTEELVGLVIDELNANGVEYMVTGSLASNAFGIPRMTKDADFVLHVKGREVQEIASNLQKHFRLEPQMGFETITSTHKNKLKHLDSHFEVELFDLSDEPFDRVRFARRRRETVLGRDTWLPTPEDVIIQKLRWSRHHGRSRDVEDARNVLDVQRDKLDWLYLEEWCRQHSTLDLLHQLRDEAP